MGLTFNTGELESKLESLSKKVQKEMLDKALEEGSKPILKAMESNVPVDTGELKNSLGELKKQGSGIKRKVHLGSKSTDRKIVERAYYQEHGNSSMVGKKWMKKSYHSAKDEAVKSIADEISKHLLGR